MITILDIAKARGAKEHNGALHMGEFDRLGLPMFGGCQVCNASIAAYNAHPGRNGYLIGSCCACPEDTYETVAEYNMAEETAVLRRLGQGDGLSRCVTEIRKLYVEYDEMCADVDLFHGGAECYPSADKFHRQLDDVCHVFGYHDLEEVRDTVTARCTDKISYYYV